MTSEELWAIYEAGLDILDPADWVTIGIFLSQLYMDGY